MVLLICVDSPGYYDAGYSELMDGVPVPGLKILSQACVTPDREFVVIKPGASSLVEINWFSASWYTKYSKGR